MVTAEVGGRSPELRGTGGALLKGDRARSALGVLKLVGRYSNGHGSADLSALFFKSPTETGAALEVGGSKAEAGTDELKSCTDANAWFGDVRVGIECDET